MTKLVRWKNIQVAGVRKFGGGGLGFFMQVTFKRVVLKAGENGSWGKFC